MRRNAKEASQELNIDHKTVKLYFSFYRKCIHHYMRNDFYPAFKFDTKWAVEWDEAALNKEQKNHMSAARKPQWCLGGIQRETGFVCVEHVKERDAETLQSYIVQHSKPRGVHITDGWKGYIGLDGKPVYHFNLSHKDGFAHPMTKMHTNTIECEWSLIRPFLC